MKWDVWNSVKYDPAIVAEADLAVSPLVAAVLWARGIKSASEAQDFLCTEKFHDPMLMAGMADGVARVQRAIEDKETVAIFGDYDADGITATALMVDYLRAKGLDCKSHIPCRLTEGYGPNIAVFERFQADGVTLVITVDCGIAAVEVATAAAEMGLDLIITDHHECQDQLPQAIAVIDPKRPDCAYPDKELAGVGVAFQFALAIEGTDSAHSMRSRFGDLVAVGTVADVMDLTGENRALVSAGLCVLRDGARPGLLSLMEETGITPAAVTATNLGFALAPRINAAGRMGDAGLALSLLVTHNPIEAKQIARALCLLNQERQSIEHDILAEALEMLEKQGYTAGPIFLCSETWHKGVLGIVAARLMARYREPVIMICVEDGVGKGSCRGVPGFSFFDALTACQPFLQAFGGHHQAAGLTVEASLLSEFQAAFLAYYEQNPPHAEAGILQADLTLTCATLLTLEQIKSLARLEPCGKGNPAPMLIIEGAVLQKVQPIGGGKHVKLQICKWGQVYDCVFFSVTASDLGAVEGDTVDVAFHPDLNHFRGKTTVQFLVCDLVRTEFRRIFLARQVFADLSNGQSPVRDVASQFTPGREDFVRLWRGLQQTSDGLRGSFDQVCGTLGQRCGVLPAKVYLCLQIFCELGLLEVREAGDVLEVLVSPSAGKVDLNASGILQALQRATEGCA